MEPFQSRGRLVAGVSFDIPGMGYRDAMTGRISGFEVGIARAVGGKLLGSADQVELVQVEDRERIAALDSGRVDMVVSQLTVTPDRAEQVDFSIPYYTTREGILVPVGSSIRTFDDLAGKRIAVTDGSISLRRMTAALPSLPGATLVLTALSAGNLAAVEAGEADAASNDMINLTMLRMGSGRPDDFTIIDIGARFDPKPFAIAVRKGSPGFVGLLDKAIGELTDDGTIQALLDAALASFSKPATPA